MTVNIGIPTIFKNDRFLVSLVTLLGFAVRLPSLGNPLHGDEAITFNRYGLLFWDEILLNYPDTNQHALFSILSNFSMQLFGENEIAFRLPALVAGVFAVPLLYLAGRSLDFSFQTAFFAACLLALSGPHVHYSQAGRGYSQTVFLALALMLAVAKIQRGRNPYGWGGLLILSGFCMALTLPSNAVFLASAAVFCIAAKWLEQSPDRVFFDKQQTLLALFFSILALLVAGYFYIIFSGLKVGLRGNNYTPINAAFFLDIALYLATPWGYWFFALLGLGLIDLKGKKAAALFAAVFGIPVITAWSSGVGGFPRIYIYLLPFVLLLAARGISRIAVIARSLKPLLANIVLAALAAGVALASAGDRVNLYTEKKNYKAASTMAEARQVLSHVEKNVPDDRLPILLLNPEESILNRYFQAWLKQSMFNFALGKKLDKIFILTHKDFPPESNLMFAYFPGHILKLPNSSMKQTTSVGGIDFHEFDKRLSRIFPPVYDPDYETRLDIANSPLVKAAIEENQKMLGDKALVLKKTMTGNVMITSRIVKSFHITEEGYYLLTIYLRKYGQGSKVFLADNDPASWPPDIGHINPYFGEVVFPGSKFRWQMVFLISPISAGQHNLVEVFYLENEISYFDGIQSYLLH